jgi:hypothetical protein
MTRAMTRGGGYFRRVCTAELSDMAVEGGDDGGSVRNDSITTDLCVEYWSRAGRG